jgi:hypothetical protein
VQLTPTLGQVAVDVISLDDGVMEHGNLLYSGFGEFEYRLGGEK